jgi:NAD(P)H-dependent flavin oxidoreductase YrpB (nitropropane dioxygenase family)
MLNFTEILGSQYPIVAMAMNQVSDIKLAKAVSAAGAIPSLSIFNYYVRGLSGLKQDLDEFNGTKIVISLGVAELIAPKLLKLIVDYKIEFVELIPDTKGEFAHDPKKDADKHNALAMLKANGVKLFIKCLEDDDVDLTASAIIIKGNDGAGRGVSPTRTLFNSMRKKYPSMSIIVSGGVGTADDVKYYMDNGALAVGIGTLLAASQESKISIETKLKMIEATANDLGEFTVGAKQKSLIFKETADDYNHTHSLIAGITNPTTGHVFAGNAIDQVTEIKPVADIINALVAKL